jgi:hypothetical protein
MKKYGFHSKLALTPVRRDPRSFGASDEGSWVVENQSALLDRDLRQQSFEAAFADRGGMTCDYSAHAAFGLRQNPSGSPAGVCRPASGFA